jgi:hypothetical protein
VTEPATADDLDAAAQSLLAALAATALTRDTDPDFEESTARLADRLEALASRLPAMLEVIAAAEKWACEWEKPLVDLTHDQHQAERLVAAVRALREATEQTRRDKAWSERVRIANEGEREALTDEQ